MTARQFTASEKNEALELAYSMGLKRPYAEEDTDDAMSFACAMGLKRYSAPAHKNNSKPGKGIFVPRPSFI